MKTLWTLGAVSQPNAGAFLNAVPKHEPFQFHTWGLPVLVATERETDTRSLVSGFTHGRSRARAPLKPASVAQANEHAPNGTAASEAWDDAVWLHTAHRALRRRPWLPRAVEPYVEWTGARPLSLGEQAKFLGGI